MLNIFSDINASASESVLLLTFDFIFFHKNQTSIMGGYSTFVSRQSQGKIKHRSVDCMYYLVWKIQFTITKINTDCLSDAHLYYNDN